MQLPTNCMYSFKILNQYFHLLYQINALNSFYIQGTALRHGFGMTVLSSGSTYQLWVVAVYIQTSSVALNPLQIMSYTIIT
jgi:hypothetical protein